MTSLKHNDLVRLPAWDKMTAASVFTLEGYLNDGKDHGITVEECVARGEERAATIYTGSAIVNSRRYYEELQAKVATAITIEDGEEVEIEGRRYQVKVVRGNLASPRNSDPIKFIEI